MTDPTTDPTVQVAGLLIPASLVARIVEACRGLYPSLTAGLGDDDSVRAVLKSFIGSILADWEARQAGGGVDDEVNRIRDDYHQRAEDARQQALEDASVITAAPAPAPTPTP